MTCEEFEGLLAAKLAEDLPRAARKHADRCEACTTLLAAEAKLTQVLHAFGRPAMDDAFFERQHGSIMARLEAQAREVAETWRAPAGSLVFLAMVVGVYTFFGLEGLGEAFTSAAGSPDAVGVDPLNSVALIYLGLGALAVHAATREHGAGEPQRVAARV